MMDFRKVKVADLKLAPWNPRIMSGEEMRKLVKSLHEFGVVEPLVINADKIVLGGNQRLEALKALGVEEVDCIEVSLSPAKEKALSLALNKIHGEWDLPKLKDILEAVDTGELPDIEISGFTEIEAERLMTAVPPLTELPEVPITCPKCGYTFE